MRRVASILALLLALSAPAAATLVIRDDVQTLARDCRIIVRADVAATETVRDARGRIVSLAHLDVVEGLRGAAPGERLTVTQLGGTLDGETLFTGGRHRFAAGQEVVLFAEPLRPGVVIPCVPGLGRFDVVREPGWPARLEERVADVVAVSDDGRPGIPQPRVYVDLDAFRAQVRLALTRARPSPGRR